MVERSCDWCRKSFMARAVDVKRGWAKFCSKSCKASEQEKRTRQNRAHLVQRSSCTDDDEQRMHEDAMDAATAGWDEGGWLSDDSGMTS
jgi:hypothetical protein